MSMPSHAELILGVNVIEVYLFWVVVHVLIVLAIWVAIVALMKRSKKRVVYRKYRGLNEVRVYSHKKVS